jgi:hypothetical protein
MAGPAASGALRVGVGALLKLMRAGSHDHKFGRAIQLNRITSPNTRKWLALRKIGSRRPERTKSSHSLNQAGRDSWEGSLPADDVRLGSGVMLHQ